MQENRVREIRKRQKLTLEELAERAQLSVSYLSRLEAGKRQLYVKHAKAIAMALQVPVSDIIPNGGTVTGFHDDVEPYKAGPSDPFAGMVLPENHFPYMVKTHVLDDLGIMPGHVLIASDKREIVEAVQPMAIVIAQLYDDDELLRAVTILRQFIPPDLLITNSSRDNADPLHRRRDHAQIKAVVVAHHRSLLG